jgi:sphinganine-1-phosphate aldolase
MAVKTHRDYYRHYRGIRRPNVVACRTAHPAFDKACQYLGIQVGLRSFLGLWLNL